MSTREYNNQKFLELTDFLSALVAADDSFPSIRDRIAYDVENTNKQVLGYYSINIINREDFLDSFDSQYLSSHLELPYFVHDEHKHE